MNDVFLSRIRLETAAKIKDLRITLGEALHQEHVDALVPGIGVVARVEVSVLRVEYYIHTQYRMRSELIAQACGQIAEARLGKETVWDDGGDEQIISMLAGIMPGGYQRKA